MEKIQELTDKIFREGVEKGQAEAERIINEAKEQAAKIVADAKTQAEAIQQQTAKVNRELEANTKSELRLYVGQSLNALKSEIANVVSNKIVNQAVNKLADDKDFLGKFAISLAERWSKNENIVISTSDAAALKAFFAKEAKALLDKGVDIEQVNGQKALFSIKPADGSYRVDFGKEEFESFFKSFLRPQLIDMLF